MNNCPKCGNPLQVGTTSCPICGTNIAVENTQPAKTTVTVASVAQPATEPTAPVVQVEQTVTPATEPAAPVVSSEPATSAPAPVTEPVTETVAPTTEAVTQPVTEAPVVTTEPAVATEPVVATPTTEAAPEVITQPVTEVPVDPNSIAPTIAPIEQGTPVPSIPASLNPDANVSTEVVAPTPQKPTKPKKGINKNFLIILILVLVAGGVGAIFMMGPSSKPSAPLANNQNEQTVATTAVSTNGYKLQLKDGWIITEDGDNVIIMNADETVALKLAHSAVGISAITEDTIKNYFTSRTDFTETEIIKTTISAKDGFLVNTKMVEAPIQVYFIGGGTNLTIGATIVYTSPESKTKYEADVSEMIGSVSYSDESLKAITAIDMYNGAFSLYNGIISSATQPQVPENNVVNPQPENGNVDAENQTPTTTPEQNGTTENNNQEIVEPE